MMKILFGWLRVLVVVSCGLVANGVKADIAEMDDMDLQELAQGAALQNKQLMVVYYAEHCKPCEAINSEGGEDAAEKARSLASFEVYKTNVNAGFSVTCPAGEQFSDREFMSIKGITSLPAVVITDSFGNVVSVENGVLTRERLLAVADQYKHQNMVAK